MKKFDTETTLIRKGYSRYNPSPHDSDCVTDCYQSAFRNDKGDRQYFITWYKWDFSRYEDSNHPDLSEPSFEADTQLTTKDGDVLNITFLCGWDPEKTEKFMKKLFDTGWFKEYDNRDEDE